jgi:mono/diheme cytochrome c family protein
MTTAGFFMIASCAQKSAPIRSGENLFKLHCQPCHPAGGNVINPMKTLYKKDLDANNIKTADDIIRVMRSGALGMMKFDEKSFSDKDSLSIADYILQNFE